MQIYFPIQLERFRELAHDWYSLEYIALHAIMEKKPRAERCSSGRTVRNHISVSSLNAGWMTAYTQIKRELLFRGGTWRQTMRLIWCWEPFTHPSTPRFFSSFLHLSASLPPASCKASLVNTSEDRQLSFLNCFLSLSLFSLSLSLSLVIYLITVYRQIDVKSHDFLVNPAETSQVKFDPCSHEERFPPWSFLITGDTFIKACPSFYLRAFIHISEGQVTCIACSVSLMGVYRLSNVFNSDEKGYKLIYTLIGTCWF